MTAPRKLPTPRETMVGLCRVFLLIGVFLVCHAVYKYDEYTKFDATPGFKLMFDNSVYIRLYEWGGKWAVVKFIAVLAVGSLAVSAFAWRMLRTMPRNP